METGLEETEKALIARHGSWSYVATSQGMPGIASNTQKLEDIRKILPYSLHSEHGHANTLISNSALQTVREHSLFPVTQVLECS